METEKRESFVLSERDESAILLFCEVARANGAALSLREILNLTSLDATEEEVANAWSHSHVLDSKYLVRYGLILDKNQAPQIVSARKKSEDERKIRAIKSIEYSQFFVPFLGRRGIRSLSISGSTSYLSVSETDDLDFFTITWKNSVWLFLTKALLLSRARRVLLPQSPEICFSYTADEDFVSDGFLKSRNGLFARDALTALPILGASFYDGLLRKCSWMSEFFPKVYETRLAHSQTGDVGGEETKSIAWKIANWFFYYTVGSYVRMKSAMLNRRFAKWRKYDRIFKLKIGPDHCIFEARSYVNLRKIYSRNSSHS